MKKCPFCAEDVQDEAKVCKHCQKPIGPPSETQSAAAAGAARGVGMGVMGFGCLFIPGVLLSLTGIGAIIGVPLMIMAFIAPLLLGMVGMLSIKGHCPHCGGTTQTLRTSPSFTCPHCTQPVRIKDGKFTAA